MIEFGARKSYLMPYNVPRSGRYDLPGSKGTDNMGLGWWKDFKELLKNRFYPMSLQKAKEDEFIRLQQGKMGILEYASKFIEFSYFTPGYVGDEKLRMNRFEAGLNPRLKEKMSVRHYTLYEDIYDTTVNVERAIKKTNEFYNDQRGIKRCGD